MEKKIFFLYFFIFLPYLGRYLGRYLVDFGDHRFVAHAALSVGFFAETVFLVLKFDCEHGHTNADEYATPKDSDSGCDRKAFLFCIPN